MIFNEKISNPIVKLLKKEGTVLFDDAVRFNAILNDLLPQYQRELFLIELSVKEDVPKMLFCDNKPKQDKLIQLSKLKDKFQKDYFLSEEASVSLIELWEKVYEIYYNSKNDKEISVIRNGRKYEIANENEGEVLKEGTTEIKKSTEKALNIKEDSNNSLKISVNPKPEVKKETVRLNKEIHEKNEDSLENNSNKIIETIIAIVILLIVALFGLLALLIV